MDSTTTIEASAVLYGYLGAASSLVFASAGAAYGTYKSAQGMANAENGTPLPVSAKYTSLQDMSGVTPEGDEPAPLSVKFMIPVVMSGVLAIYGLIFSVIALSQVTSPDYTLSQGYGALGAGLMVGLCCLFGGLAIGKVARSGIPHAAKNPSSFTRFVLSLVYCEALGLYGLIGALIASS